MRVPILIAMTAIVAAGCATPDRSRNLNSPAVSASTVAQQVCSNCHGIDGNSVSPNFPRLAAQTGPYLIEQLREFRAHDRSDPAGFEYMWGLSRHLTDAQIDGLATYFSSQAATGNAPAKDEALAEAGKAIFENGKPERNLLACKTCHGDRAQGNAAIPRLAGQHSDYLVKQLYVFQRTEQRPEGAVMKAITHLMDPTDMDAVAAYLQGLS